MGLSDEFTEYLTKTYHEEIANSARKSSNCDTVHLTVLLNLSPEVLQNQKAFMQKITARFYQENWVIQISFGKLINLAEVFEPFKAAKSALTEVTKIDKVKSLALDRYESLEVRKMKTVIFFFISTSLLLELHRKD